MAEAAKMLNPDKNVYLANPSAGCPMAEQMEPEMIEMIKAQEPDRKVVCYINTTAALKRVCDVLRYFLVCGEDSKEHGR